MQDLKEIIIQKDVFEHDDSFFGVHLRDQSKEDIHFKIVDEQTW